MSKPASDLPDHLIATDGMRLHVSHWPVARPRGVVQSLHGFGEHQGRMAGLAHALNRLGWTVAGVDHRHNGRSDGQRGVVRDGDDLLRDQALVHDALRARHPGLPLVMVGQSFGGLIAARFAAEMGPPAEAERPTWSRPVDGVVLIAPALAPALSPPQSATLAVLSRMVPDLPVSLSHLQAWSSSVPEVVAQKRQDPLVHATMTPRLVQHMLASARAVFERLPSWQVPTLLCHATADRLVAPSAAQRFLREVPPGWVDDVPCVGMAHDLLHEPCAPELTQRIAQWVDLLPGRGR